MPRAGKFIYLVYKVMHTAASNELELILILLFFDVSP